MTLALLFPGQGSQHVGMGRELAAAFEDARAVFDEADRVLGFPLSELMWEGPEEELTATENAQPAILTHSVAAYRVGRERLGAVGMAAGHSLGEFSAHVAARTFSFADALEAVRLRGELMASAGRTRPGTMAAVLGLPNERVEEVCREVETGVCVPAN
ncbi:MAG TPA: ACP S-malonyltransferase, partial [Longimicrobiales bacterium]|nr:ACP S-malonyltransferase [Longimicrobiales bacterium]